MPTRSSARDLLLLYPRLHEHPASNDTRMVVHSSPWRRATHTAKETTVTRETKSKLSTVVGCVLAGVTFTGPLGGAILADWQCKRGLCDHAWHRHRYQRRGVA